jgi:hypothetical protein
MTLPPLAPAVARSLRRVVQGKARRGVFAGKHIRFGNKVSEDGGNKYVRTRAPFTTTTTTTTMAIANPTDTG